MIFHPGTYVRLLANIPLDNTYSHTFTFQNEQAQIDYFTSKAVYIYDDFSYQRYNPNRGKLAAIRIPMVAEKLYTINYIMFRNNNFGTKWFYAFVLEVNYINDGMTELVYELDVMQTWMFDYTVHECFVEREHTNNDAIGANLVDEDLKTGPYKTANYNFCFNNVTQNCAIGLAATFDKNYQPKQGISIGRTYNGLCITLFKTSDALATFLEGASNVVDGIVSIFMVPSLISQDYFLWDVEGVETPDIIEAINGAPSQYNWQISKNYSSFDGYTPKNNKVYQYPYNFIRILGTGGQTLDLRFELFSSSNCVLNIWSNITINPFLELIPKNYLGAPLNYSYRMVLEGFPQCSYVTDVYKMYLAKNASVREYQYFSAAANAGVGVASNLLSFNWGGAVESAYSGYMQVNQLMAQEKDMSRLPPSAHTGNPSSDFESGYLNFKYTNMRVTGEFARRIDEYFSMYGYKTLRLKIPNITGRQSWNFVKTIDANITGSLPADELKQIISIFDRGVTFWHTPDLGNYLLPNGIVGGG